MRDSLTLMKGIEVLVDTPYAAGILHATNLTGQPTFVAPFGVRRGGAPNTICFTGQLAGESRLLALVQALLAKTRHHHRHPKL